MVKKHILYAMLMFASPVMAQSEPGSWSVYPRVGVALANISDMDITYNVESTGNTLKSKLSPGLTAGAELEYQATDQLSVTFGAIYSQLGCRYPEYSEDKEGSSGSKLTGISKMRYQLHYINVPVLLNGYLAKGLAVKAGVQLGWLVDANYRWSETEITIEKGDAGLNKYTDGATTEHCTNIASNLNRFDISIPVGISYEYMNVVLDARYNYGLLKTFKSDAFKGSHNRYFTLTLGYKFTL